jgi:hypothetical protein
MSVEAKSYSNNKVNPHYLGQDVGVAMIPCPENIEVFEMLHAVTIFRHHFPNAPTNLKKN